MAAGEDPEGGPSFTAAEIGEILRKAGLSAERVVAEMAARRPGSAALRRMAEEAEAASPAKQPWATGNPGLLQEIFSYGGVRIIRPHLHHLDVELWLLRLREARNRVCLVEIGTEAPGTGFLVGPAAVLTNWHVVASALETGGLKEARCRFNYARLPDGRRGEGFAIPLAGEAPAAASPASRAERENDPAGAPPLADELDFALLRLAEPVGLQEAEGGRRGWYALPERPVPLAADAPLLILQHPRSGPMKLAMDTQSVIGPVAGGLRIRYRTNTEAGSSGSPVFTMDWEPALLHHLGDPARGTPMFNQGIPLHLIRAAIIWAGAGAELGETA